MQLRHAFAANAAFHFLLGAVFVIAPEGLLGFYGVTLEPGALWGARLLGVGLFGIGLLLWSLRSSEDGRAIAKGLLMINGMACAVFLQATLRGSISVRGWTLVALYAVLSGWYRASA